MCGIAGIIDINYSLNGEAEIKQICSKMLSQIQYRGPDSFIVKNWDNVAFGHVRLSIVDLSNNSEQPLSFANSRYWITFNGEIYNFIEIRHELEAKGYHFLTESDTEVILAAYHLWGAKCLNYLNGMWAFAIYDRQEKTCFLARDRFGVKPLYYAFQNQKLLFASEIKALLAAGVSRKPCLETIQWYFHDAGCDRGDLSPFEAIRQLPAGNYMIVKSGKHKITRWWETLDNRVEVASTFAKRVEHFQELMKDAVRIRLRNDVDTGITLSGGMDSSTIYSLAKTLQNNNQVVSATDNCTKDIEVFSVSYPNQKIDESYFVEQCLEVYQDKATYIYPNSQDFPKLLNEVIWHQESFVWNASVFAFHAIYRQIAKAGIKVIIEGHGSDEMLAGYPYLVRLAMTNFRQRQDWLNVWKSAQCLSQTLNPTIEEKANSTWKTFLKEVPGFGNLLLLWNQSKKRLIQPPSSEDCRSFISHSSYLAPELLTIPENRFLTSAEQELDIFHWNLYDAFHRRIVPNVLRVFDRATMASSLESRMPFMDYRVVQYIFSLPSSDIVGNGENKHILRQSMRNILPKTITNRKEKLGFAGSLKQWFDDPLVYEHIRNIVYDSSFTELEFVDVNIFKKYFERCVDRGFTWQDTARIWEVLNFYLWKQIFVKNII